MALPTTPRRFEFGYFPEFLSISSGPVTITTLTELEKSIADVEGSCGTYREWIYAPRQQELSFGGNVHEKPYSARVFGLPKTHTIEHAAADSNDHLVFHIWALSFFTGMRLTSTEAGFLDATPIKPGKLVDFVLLGKGLVDAVEISEAFWVRHRGSPAPSRLFAAAIHALFLGQNPQNLAFERFLLCYTAFDACFALAKHLFPSRTRVVHAERVDWMCKLFAMPVPDWADPNATAGPEIASVRNATVHEALFMGEPLGFATYGAGASKNITLEMRALICRLLVALLGCGHAAYVGTPVNTRQRHGLNLAIP